MIEKLRTWIEIDQKALLGNTRSFLQLIPESTIFMAVIKSNAYGHGLVETAQVLSSVKDREIWFGLDSITEALALRKKGIKNKLLVLGQTLPSRLSEAHKNKITVTVSNFSLLAEIGKTAVCPRFFLKIDSGMHRQGFMEDDLFRLLANLKISRLAPLGIYTHLASPTDPRHKKFTESQFKKFLSAVKILQENGFKNLIKSASSSGGVLGHPETALDMVRVGIGLYGYPPSLELKSKISLRPVLSWKTRISELKEVPASEFVGYGLTAKTQRPTRIAVLPVGYWHGYDRRLSDCGEILAGGKRAKIIGRVSMDMIVADVTEIAKIKEGDEAVLLGRQGQEEIWADDIARQMQTGYHYEFLTRLNPLIKRFLV